METGQGTAQRRPKLSPKLWAINTPWTSQTAREGWRHYRIAARRRQGRDLTIEMMGVCEREIRFWIPAEELKNPELWAPGWA